MHEQTTQQRTLPAIVLNYLANSNDDLIDLSSLEEVMDNEEQSTNKGIVVNVKAELIEHTVEGTLSSRIRQIAHECTEGHLQAEFRAMASAHPAYAKIYDEVKEHFNAGSLLDVIQRLEELGCEVAYDRKTFQLSIGLNKGRLFKHFNEHSRVIDLRNRNSIHQVNGVNTFLDKEPKHEVPDLDYRTYYLVMKLNE